MKLYAPAQPPRLLRINIKKQGIKTEFLTVQDCEQNEFYEWLKALIEKQNISPFTKGKVTNIEIRIGEGKTNGKSISLSFKGMEPTEAKELILKNIDK